MELLDKTSSRMPARVIAIIFRGGYSISGAMGHEPVQTPHWIQAKIFSPPGVAATSSIKLLISAVLPLSILVNSAAHFYYLALKND